MGTKPSIFQPGHDGRPQAVPDVPAHHMPSRGADAFTGHHRPDIARDGAPKNHHDVSVHGGMTARQRELKGMSHAIGSAPDASAANPLDKTVPGKTFSDPRPTIGQRSRTRDTVHGGAPGENHAKNCGHGCNADLGRAILDQALAASAPDDRRAHGRE